MDIADSRLMRGKGEEARAADQAETGHTETEAGYPASVVWASIIDT